MQYALIFYDFQFILARMGNLVQGTWELYAKWSRHIAEYRPAMW
jgi:hypothetical protein